MGHPEVWGPAGDHLLIVGLTGGIASGKTEVDRQLEKLGLLVIDADEVARCVVEPGTTTYDTIVGTFGDGVLDSSGCIDRAALASIVFSDDEKRIALNGITHPAIFQEMMRRVSARAETLTEGDVPAGVLDAALIVDTGVSGVFDMLVVVTADEDKRVERMVRDRGMSEPEARDRIASQTPEAKRVAMADVVIENNGTIEDLRRSVAVAFKDMSERARGDYS